MNIQLTMKCQDVGAGRPCGDIRMNPPPAMKNDEKSPVNEWNYATARLGYLTGGPLDSLVVQLSRSGVSPPAVVAELPVIAPERSTCPIWNLESTDDA